MLVFETASEGPLPESLVQAMDAAFGLDDPLLTMNYQDARRGIWKKVRVDDGVITGARLSGETAARDWIKGLIAEGASAMEVRNWLLAPVEQAAGRQGGARAHRVQLPECGRARHRRGGRGGRRSGCVAGAR